MIWKNFVRDLRRTASRLISVSIITLIAVMVYSFARVGAALGLKVEDYYTEGRKAWFRLHEKGGKRHEVPAHHNAADYVDAYLAAAGIAGEKKNPLFRSAAVCCGTRTIGVILSGMGRDGLVGSRALVASGGAVLSQDPVSSSIWGMPRGAGGMPSRLNCPSDLLSLER